MSETQKGSKIFQCLVRKEKHDADFEEPGLRVLFD